MLYLTFDDGPDPVFTPQVLSVLRAHDAQATFFMVGEEAARHPGLVEKVRRDGHAVGNHTWDHPWLTTLSGDAVQQQLIRTREVTGPGRCLRAPYGASNAEVHAAAGVAGYRQVWHWSVDTRDWTEPGVPAITASILEGASPGAVQLMHDGGIDRSQTVEALDRALTRLAAQGWSFEALPGC
ncbi:polysaccharide deacetylase family protein [Kytococcus sedentarius]|uniref:polysaccharide deacetylase family protein n=1 Tax=Kytococcus sedentarius TaxID=1276 RepID=UPI0035BBE91D